MLVTDLFNLGIKNDLCDSFPVTKVDEDQAAKVTSAVHPSHQQGILPDAVCPEASAVMGSSPVI